MFMGNSVQDKYDLFMHVPSAYYIHIDASS